MNGGTTYGLETIAWKDIISDRVIPKHLRKQKLMNACFHRKETHSALKYATGNKTAWNGTPFNPEYSHEQIQGLGVDSKPTTCPGLSLFRREMSSVSITEPSISDILSKVTNPEKNNLGTDIAELLTAGGAIAGIAEMFSPGTILGLAQEVSRMNLRGIAKGAIQIHLQAIYGYLPFYDSLMKLVFSLAHFDYWANNLGKTQKVTFKRIVNRENISGTHRQFVGGSQWSEATISYDGQFSVVRRYHATVYLNKTSFNPLEKFLLFLDYVDLSVDASDVWAVVPCSFVIDWFLPIADALKDFDNFASAELWSIGDTYVTEKIRFNSHFSKIRGTDWSGYYPNEPAGSWTSTINQFERRDWSPRISSFKGVSLPNGWQTASMAELAGAMFL